MTMNEKSVVGSQENVLFYSIYGFPEHSPKKSIPFYAAKLIS